MKGKVAVVTGAAAGIGKAIVGALVGAGASVLAADMSEDALGSLKKEVGASGAVETVRADVSDQSDAEGMIDAAIERFGRLDVLVNNAGIMDLFAGVGELDVDLWRKIMAVNVDGPMFAMRRAVPVMIGQGGGAIVNIASAAALGGAAAGAAYTASKHALVGLTVNTAWTYAPDNIRCNAIAPGGVSTSIGKSMPTDRLDQRGRERLEPFQAISPGMLEPEAIAQAVVFLAGPGSEGVNGVVLPIDRGWRAA